MWGETVDGQGPGPRADNDFPAGAARRERGQQSLKTLRVALQVCSFFEIGIF